MRLIRFAIIFIIYFGAVEVLGEEPFFGPDVEIYIEGNRGDVVLINNTDVTMACAGTVEGDTYFDDTPSLPFSELVLSPGEYTTLYISSRYGDPFEAIWLNIECFAHEITRFAAYIPGQSD